MITKEDISLSLRYVPCPKVEIFVEMFCAKLYKAYYGAAMLEYLLGPPIWLAVNSVSVWNLDYLVD